MGMLCAILAYGGLMWEMAPPQKFNTAAGALVGIMGCLLVEGDVRRRKLRLVRERQRTRERLNHRIDRHIAALTRPPHTAQLRRDLFLATLISQHSRGR